MGINTCSQSHPKNASQVPKSENLHASPFYILGARVMGRILSSIVPVFEGFEGNIANNMLWIIVLFYFYFDPLIQSSF